MPAGTPVPREQWRARVAQDATRMRRARPLSHPRAWCSSAPRKSNELSNCTLLLLAAGRTISCFSSNLTDDLARCRHPRSCLDDSAHWPVAVSAPPAVATRLAALVAKLCTMAGEVSPIWKASIALTLSPFIRYTPIINIPREGSEMRRNRCHPMYFPKGSLSACALLKCSTHLSP